MDPQPGETLHRQKIERYLRSNSKTELQNMIEKSERKGYTECKMNLFTGLLLGQNSVKMCKEKEWKTYEKKETDDSINSYWEDIKEPE